MIFSNEASAQAGRHLNVSMGIKHGDKYLDSVCTVVTEYEAPIEATNSPATHTASDGPPVTPNKTTYTIPHHTDTKKRALEEEQARQRESITGLETRVQENSDSIGAVRKDVSSLLQNQEIQQMMEKPDWHTPNTADHAVCSIVKGSLRNVSIGDSYYMVITNVAMDKYVVMHGDVVNVDGREISWVVNGEDPDESEVFVCLRDFAFARNERAQKIAENVSSSDKLTLLEKLLMLQIRLHLWMTPKRRMRIWNPRSSSDHESCISVSGTTSWSNLRHACMYLRNYHTRAHIQRPWEWRYGVP